jgi:hypothetical protein
MSDHDGMPVLPQYVHDVACLLLGPVAGMAARCFSGAAEEDEDRDGEAIAVGLSVSDTRCSRPNEPCLSTRRAASLLEARCRGSTPTKVEAQRIYLWGCTT